jgi:hypothetical protein
MRSVRKLLDMVCARRLERVKKICFSHVPKCAGAALGHAIARRYGILDRILIRNFHLESEASGNASKATSVPVRDLRENVLAYVLAEGKYKYVSGHFRCRPATVAAFREEWHFITMLRHPIDRWISGYVYDRYKLLSWAQTDLSVEQFLESRRGRINGMMYLIYFSNIPQGPLISNYQQYVDEAEANLRSFALVGILENLEEVAQTFCGILGKPLKVTAVNPSPNPQAAEEIRKDKELMERIAEVCQPDIELYRRFVKEPNRAGWERGS